MSMPTSILQSIALETRSLLKDRPLRWDIAIFLSYFLGAKLAQYILFNLHTSPALIWAPTGIALGAVLLKGSRMWLPIAAAYLAAVLTLPGYLPLGGIIFAAAGFTLQPVLGAWGLKKVGSNGTIHKTTDVMLLVIGSFIIAAIGPLVNTVGQVLLHTLSASVWLTFTRAWAGGVLSIIIITPLMTGWYHSLSWPFSRQQLPDALSAFGLLGIIIYLLFWTNFAGSYVFLLIFFLCVALFWIALRFGSRAIVSALALLAVFGIMGSIVAHPTPTPLNTQLFADELFIILIAPIFLMFFTVVDERRTTQRNLAEKVADLERMTAQLSQNDKTKNEFIAILAHELRNPLSTIVSTLELLKLETLTQDAKVMIDRGEQQIQAMRRLLDDLLDVARIAEKKFTILPEPTKLETIITHSVEAVERNMRSRGHQFSVTLPPTSITLSVDPLRIEQVITNLLNNAIKYTPAGGAISLACAIQGAQLRVEVCDNGKGIPPGYLEKIFSPFQQIDPAPHRTSGIGIGLFLTRQIVEMHGGTIRAQSEGEGRGSCFTVLLPLPVKAPQQTVKPKIKIRERFARHMTPKENVSEKSAANRRYNILVVDDNEAAAMGLSKLLSHLGHTTSVAHSGAQALDIFEVFKPDVVLLDIGLPDMTGYKVAERLRAVNQGRPLPTLIALTGYGQEEDKALARTAGFDHHLTKPVSIAEVQHVLLSARS